MREKVYFSKVLLNLMFDTSKQLRSICKLIRASHHESELPLLSHIDSGHLSQYQTLLFPSQVCQDGYISFPSIIIRLLQCTQYFTLIIQKQSSVLTLVCSLTFKRQLTRALSNCSTRIQGGSSHLSYL